MKAPEKREEALSDTEEKEKTFAFEAKGNSDALIGTAESGERKKPAGESRILPASPAETQTSENAPAKGVLRKKDVTEEDLVTYRSGDDTGSLYPSDESEQETIGQSSDEAPEGLLRAKQPLLRDYAGELELAQRQQTDGNCEASIKTNEAILNSSPPPA